METNEWTILTLKAHIEKIIEDRDRAVHTAFYTSQKAVEKAEDRLDRILEGFPQEYSKKEEFDQLRKMITDINNDHVQRREFDVLKETQASGRGARIALAATSGIVLALITITLGAMYANQLNNTDVSNQIEREAPWLADKPGIEDEIKTLQQQELALKLEIADHESADKIRATIDQTKG